MAKLRRIKLLGKAAINEPDTMDAYPLVREYFKQQLKREHPDAWREANNRLYEHLKRTAKELPDTVEEMSPLFAAVSHGCAAGRYQEALREAGCTEEAAAVFRNAEEMQKQQEPAYPVLYSMRGFNCCDLLLDQKQFKEVKERAAWALEIAKSNNLLLSIALANLSLGRAWLLEAQRAHTGDTTQAAEFLQRAVDGLRQAGQMDYIPHGLLARAASYRVNGDYGRAERDLAEVLRIAMRGGMGLHLADYHLESARLHLAQGNRDKAREHWETAKVMIERMGYHRRDKEVTAIAEQLP